jgi:hypothetical protein
LAQEAYEELVGGQVAGSPFRLDTDIRYSAEMDVQHYSPPPPAWSIGQPVTLTGWVHVLVAEPVLSAAEGEGDDIRAQLTAWGGTQYDLTGPRVAELTDVGFEDVQIQGTIIAQVEERHWQVEVTDWETVPQRQPHCLVGTFTLDGGESWLVTDEGEHFRLPNPPAELSDGQRIEVCADELPAEGDALHWWSITSPPMSAGEGYVGSSSSSVVVVVEVPVEEPLPATPTPVGAAEAPAGTPTPVAPPPQVETVFEIGQSVEVTGVVYATIYMDGDERRVEAQLDVDEPREELPSYPLVGPQELLEEIVQHHRFHVRVSGHIIPGTEVWAPNGQAIEVERFERLWPDEHVQGFLGHIDLETLEGREVAVLTDHETDQRYVLAPSLEVEGYWTAGRDPILDFEQFFMAGVVHPANTYGGLPILQPVSSRYGRETEAATSADQFPLEVWGRRW